jgi:hypothetical protein
MGGQRAVWHFGGFLGEQSLLNGFISERNKKVEDFADNYSSICLASFGAYAALSLGASQIPHIKLDALTNARFRLFCKGRRRCIPGNCVEYWKIFNTITRNKRRGKEIMKIVTKQFENTTQNSLKPILKATKASPGTRLYRIVYNDITKNDGPFSFCLNIALATALTALSNEITLSNCSSTTENLNCIGLTSARVLSASSSMFFSYRLMKNVFALLTTKEEKAKENWLAFGTTSTRHFQAR